MREDETMCVLETNAGCGRRRETGTGTGTSVRRKRKRSDKQPEPDSIKGLMTRRWIRLSSVKMAGQALVEIVQVVGFWCSEARHTVLVQPLSFFWVARVGKVLLVGGTLVLPCGKKLA